VNFPRINGWLRRSTKRDLHSADDAGHAAGADSSGGFLNFSRPSRRPLLRESRGWHFSGNHFIRQAGV